MRAQDVICPEQNTVYLSYSCTRYESPYAYGQWVHDMKYSRKLMGLVMIGRSINDLYTRCTIALLFRHLFVPLYYTAILEMKRITK